MVFAFRNFSIFIYMRLLPRRNCVKAANSHRARTCVTPWTHVTLRAAEHNIHIHIHHCRSQSSVDRERSLSVQLKFPSTLAAECKTPPNGTKINEKTKYYNLILNKKMYANKAYFFAVAIARSFRVPFVGSAKNWAAKNIIVLHNERMRDKNEQGGVCMC